MTPPSEPRPVSPVQPVILCGGSGTRLWPLSRAGFPKQFGRIIGAQSLFQGTVLRLPEPEFAAPVVVTGADFRFLVTEQLAAIGRAAAAILLEPEGRNTGPAVLAAALRAAAVAPQTLLLVCPSDHAIGDPGTLLAAVRAALPAAAAGRIVTFGVPPTRAETGYGWLEPVAGPGPTAPGPPAPCDLCAFVEKPDRAAAEAMLAGGRHLWNSGLFLFAAGTIVAAFARHAPAMHAAVAAALAAARPDLGFLRLDPAAWAAAPALSIDHAVMEKAAGDTPGLAVAPLAGGWSDLGSWEAIAAEMSTDRHGVTATGAALALDCADTLLRAESPGQALVGIGLRNIVAVAMPDAVLIADRAQGQRVGEAVRLLAARQAPQAAEFPQRHRPWGWYESLAAGERFQVKRITVHPGGILSLQSHLHRAEHWVVVEGSARVTIADRVEMLGENQSVYVPRGARHRLENPGTRDLVLIEVQSGSYLGEDDITRYEDIYARD